MLDGDMFVLVVFGFANGHYQGHFQLLTDHDVLMDSFPPAGITMRLRPFDGTFERKFILARQIKDHGDFGFSQIARINSGDACTTLMDIEHDLGGLHRISVEDSFQNHHDEIHGSIIIVV
jgi:hypothetical protein